MIEGNFCQETCGRCAPAPTAAPASDPALAPIVELEPLAAENTPEIPAEVVPFEEPEDEPAAAPAPIAEMPLPRPQVQTEPTPAQEEFLEALASEAGVLSSAPPAEREPTVERLPALTLAPPREEEPQQPSTATSPRAIPVDETRMNAVQSPPECNTTSAWDVLSSDPQLDITRRAVETLNLKEVLQNPEIQFTVSRRYI